MFSPTKIKSNKNEVNNEIFDISDNADDSGKGYIYRTFDDICHASPSKQLLIGTAAGWVFGLATMKIGKIASVSIGGGILILLVANDKGYINIDWDKISTKADKAEKKIDRAVYGKSNRWIHKIKHFSKENPFIVTAFVGGFFIGLSC